ncbi:MAG: mannosyltransferase, partial [Flavobacteriaceae bacterium]
MSNHLTTYWKLHKVPIILVALSIFFYGVFAHQLLRSDFVKLLTLFAALFFLCFKLIQFEKWNLKFLLVAGLLFRIVFFTAEPN